MKRKIFLTFFTILLANLFCMTQVSAVVDHDTEMSGNIVNAVGSDGGKVALKSTGANSKGVTVHTGESIPIDEYSFTLGKTLGDGLQEPKYEGSCKKTDDIRGIIDDWGSAWSQEGMDQGSCYAVLKENGEAVNNLRGEYSATYEQAGTYNGQSIDVKLTLVDYEYQDSDTGTPVISFSKNKIGLTVIRVRWVKVKYEFFKSGTSTKIRVKGNTTYWDVDWAQGIIIHGGNDGIYIADDNKLSINKVDDDPFIFDGGYSENNETIRLSTVADNYDTTASFTEVFYADEITRTFKFGFSQPEKTMYRSDEPPYENTIPDTDMGNENLWYGASGEMFNEATLTVIDALPAPIKSVDQENVEIGEMFTYTIEQTVYNAVNSNKYDDFKIEDTLDDCLTVDDEMIVIVNGAGTDVTRNFDIDVTGQKITITPGSGVLDDNSFYGTTYFVLVGTSIKESADLSQHKQGSKYIIPNYATVTVKGLSNGSSEAIVQNTNTVNVIYTPEVINNVPKTAANISALILVIGGLLLIAGAGGYLYNIKKKKA